MTHSREITESHDEIYIPYCKKGSCKTEDVNAVRIKCYGITSAMHPQPVVIIRTTINDILRIFMIFDQFIIFCLLVN